MRFSIILALIPAVVYAQSLNNLPTCAQNCAASGLSATGCSLLNVTCICSNTAFLGALLPCIRSNCSQQDQGTTVSFAQQLCASGNVTLSIPSTAARTNSTRAPVSNSTISVRTTSATGSVITTRLTTVSSGAATGTATATGSASAASASVTAVVKSIGSVWSPAMSLVFGLIMVLIAL